MSSKKFKCSGIELMNQELKERGFQLAISFNLSGEFFTQLAIEPIENKKPRKTPIVIPTYCPFCGKLYTEHVNKLDKSE
jgi:hypothetical protein